jgi:hypothetical protein
VQREAVRGREGDWSSRDTSDMNQEPYQTGFGSQAYRVAGGSIRIPRVVRGRIEEIERRSEGDHQNGEE